MDIATTSIDALPMDPVGSGNISMNATEHHAPISNSSPGNLDEATIHQIVSGLQEASMTGATTLPSRDIPMNSEQLTRDPGVQASYIPPPPSHQQSDYIMKENITDHYSREENVNSHLDAMYDEFQTPLLMSIIYFMFQLPIFKTTLCRYIPFLCKPDGNYNLNGYLFTSTLFAGLYYFLMKTISQFNTF